MNLTSASRRACVASTRRYTCSVHSHTRHDASECNKCGFDAFHLRASLILYSHSIRPKPHIIIGTIASELWARLLVQGALW